MELEKKPKDEKKVAEKASFYSRDTSLDEDPNDPDANTYTGEERRRRNRRNQKERRQEIRFELDKEDRRQLSGRRKDDKMPSFW